MNDLNLFIYGTSIILFVFLSLQSGYLFFFALAGRLVSLKRYKHASHTGRFIIYLFCDAEDNAAEAAEAAIALCYPSEKKHVVIISQSLQAATALTLQAMSVRATESSHFHYSKTQALQLALKQADGNFDYALLISAKDICTKGFLYRMNDAFQNGFDVVQGQHVVKHTGSAFSLLDAISEGIDTHIFCKSHQLLGLSSAITGSGVGIRYSLFKDIVPLLPESGNLNSEMELHLLRKHVHFGYAPKACLYEDRTNRHRDAHQKYQRWAMSKSLGLNSYLSYGVSELRKGNVDYLDKVFQSLLMPRILLLGITPLTVLLSFLNIPVLPANYWIVLWAVTYLAILMSMPAKYITNRFMRVVLFLPMSFINMVILLVKPKKKDGRSAYSYIP